MYKHFSIIILSLLSAILLHAQDISGRVIGEVDFSDSVRVWDGFGVNYVETSQTYDYKKYQQDYGGFSILSSKSKNKILDMTFGDNGLRPSIVKMFLDPLHQTEENGAYDHRTTTKNMLSFVKEGVRRSEKRSESISVITTLYSPPAYITKQNKIRGRDIREDKLGCFAEYMVDWAAFLRSENIPVKYISLHNEGEDWRRWKEDDTNEGLMNEDGHDYNMYMTTDLMRKTIIKLREHLDSRNLQDVGITNGENTNWYRFWAWNYAGALVDDKEALKNLSLITSHGFYVGGLASPRWFAPHSNEGVELLRKHRPDLHAWTTSTAWNTKANACLDGNEGMYYISNAVFLKELHGLIYEAHCNAVIPWALIQRASHWNKPDPNPGCAFRVYDDGTWEVRKGYYYYKQVTTVGRPGMNIARAWANDSDIAIIAFSAAETDNPNAFVVVNWDKTPYELKVRIKGSSADSYRAFRTSGEEIYQAYETARKKYPDGENCVPLPDFKTEDGCITYVVPPMSATTFVEK